MKQYEKGLTGEDMAEEFLRQQGMLSVSKRYRGQDGEIDLIMLDGDTVVMVEVKYRPGARKGAGLMAVTPAKQKRMLHAAQQFLLEREWMDRMVRFDVVEITSDGILHVPHAFTPGWY